MPEQGKISSRQFFFLIFCLILANSLYNLPTISISAAETDIWIVMLIALAIDIVVAVILYTLGLRFPNQTIFEYSKVILGKYLGSLFAIIFALFFLFMASIVLRTIGDFLTTTVMPETPMVAFLIIFLLVSGYAINSGLEVLGRLSEFVGPVLIGAIAFVMLLNLKSVDLNKLLPVFEHTPMQLFKHSLLPGSWFGVCIVMSIFMAFHNKPKETLKAKLGGVVAGVVILTLLFLQTIATLGTGVCSRQMYAIYRFTQMIHVGEIIERIEYLEVLVWIAGGFISFAILHYATTLGIAQVLKLKSYQYIAWVVGIMILFLSYLFNNISERLSFLQDGFPYLALTIEGFLTSLLLLISMIRHLNLKQ